MITNRAMADLCVAIYNYNGVKSTWDYLLGDDTTEPSAVYVGIKRIGNVDAMIFRGSASDEDWMHDAMTWSHDIHTHPRIGPVHAGGYEGMEVALDLLVPQLRYDAEWQIGGHSLGAMRSVFAAALLKDTLRKPDGVTVFGCPRPGFRQLADFMSDVPGVSYRNTAVAGRGHDYVTDVPFTLPKFPFVPWRTLSDVHAPPPINDEWGLFAYHHMPLYRGGVAGE